MSYGGGYGGRDGGHGGHGGHQSNGYGNGYSNGQSHGTSNGYGVQTAILVDTAEVRMATEVAATRCQHLVPTSSNKPGI